MTPATIPVMAGISDATSRLLSTAAGLTDEDMRAPSGLPGWSRGHVLTHVARNADGLANLLRWAATGIETPMYPSGAAREADIEAGAGRRAAELLADVRESAERFKTAAEQVPDAAWMRLVRPGPAAAGSPVPASAVLGGRLGEIEVHHIDLDSGYHPRDWPGMFVTEALPRTAADFAGRAGVPGCWLRPDGDNPLWIGSPGAGEPVTVAGPGWALLAWLTGRRNGDGLIVSPPQQLPALPPWR